MDKANISRLFIIDKPFNSQGLYIKKFCFALLNRKIDRKITFDFYGLMEGRMRFYFPVHFFLIFNQLNNYFHN